MNPNKEVYNAIFGYKLDDFLSYKTGLHHIKYNTKIDEFPEEVLISTLYDESNEFYISNTHSKFIEIMTTYTEDVNKKYNHLNIIESLCDLVMRGGDLFVYKTTIKYIKPKEEYVFEKETTRYMATIKKLLYINDDISEVNYGNDMYDLIDPDFLYNFSKDKGIKEWNIFKELVQTKYRTEDGNEGGL